METLEGFHGRQRTPEDRFHMPHGDGTHQTAQAVAEQTDGNGAQDDRGGAQGKIVIQLLCGKDLRAGRSVRGGRRRNGADGMLLQGPRSRIQELEEANAEGKLGLGSVRPVRPVRPPVSLQLIASGKEVGPGDSEEVREEDDESALNGDGCRFELRIPVLANSGAPKPGPGRTYLINLVHDRLKA